MHREIMQNTLGIRSRGQQQMAVARQPGYYGPQPGQSVVRATAGGNRKQRAPPQAATERGGSSSKRAKARQSVAGVDVGNSRVAKNRRESDLSVEKPEMVTLRTGPALEQAERWVEQWDRLQSRGSSRHLRVSTPASSSEGKWRQGVWARQQLIDNGHIVKREAEWVGMIQQQHGSLAELIPWDQPSELQKYSNSNREPD